LRRDPKAIKRLPVHMIFAVAGYASEAHTPGRAQTDRRAKAHCPRWTWPHHS
jgi:hypothetical protein